MSHFSKIKKNWNSKTCLLQFLYLDNGWEGLGAGGWDGWMASPTQWTWVWVNSGSWWWTGRTGVLRFMGSQRVGHNWVTELNWTEWIRNASYSTWYIVSSININFVYFTNSCLSFIVQVCDLLHPHPPRTSVRWWILRHLLNHLLSWRQSLFFHILLVSYPASYIDTLRVLKGHRWFDFGFPKNSIFKSRDIANKGPSSQGYGFSSGHVWMWELDCEESGAPKSWCFWTVVLEKNLESPLDCEEIQPVHSKGDQSWVFFGRNDAKAETPVLWPPHAKSWLIRKDSDAWRDWGQEEKGMTAGVQPWWIQGIRRGDGIGDQETIA